MLVKFGDSVIFLLSEVIYIICLRGKLNKSTANCMVYGELGKCCIMNSVKERMVNFWSRLVTSKQSKISYNYNVQSS